jgi:hypothetical protein
MIVIFDEDTSFINGPGTAFGGIMGGSVTAGSGGIPGTPMAQDISVGVRVGL